MFWAVIVTFNELLGGVAVLAGFLTRWAALLIAIEMTVVILRVKLTKGISWSSCCGQSALRCCSRAPGNRPSIGLCTGNPRVRRRASAHVRSVAVIALPQNIRRKGDVLCASARSSRSSLLFAFR